MVSEPVTLKSPPICVPPSTVRAPRTDNGPLNFASPATSNLAAGFSVPMPTLPIIIDKHSLGSWHCLRALVSKANSPPPSGRGIPMIRARIVWVLAASINRYSRSGCVSGDGIDGCVDFQSKSAQALINWHRAVSFLSEVVLGLQGSRWERPRALLR